MDLIIATGILEQAIQLSQKAYPAEACGLLVGRAGATRLIAMKNVSADAHQYEMDPAELIAAFRDLRETGEELVAIFHSHPHGPAEPSKTDVERAYYPEAAHLIISLAAPERPQLMAFRIVGGEVLRIEVHVIV
jgi:proteasome lid subunit RPN8/RPN11